ncbi:N-ethylmaleimide reductase [Rathayibacter sp. PhB151]|uniref:alkene reductase n=1 Tax=Rathayibacter sp. PhB151 TaxID=2485189 RepID=UPI001062F9F5|nr:alkene reductase [Rathayibacter sp. PhB151]TDX81819.1 N-ethylmaleimide reductase [Rathayibacter sp. PhB151]
MTSLLDPIALGSLPLPHRVVMAPMTRSRSAQPGNIPRRLNAEYYAQRASAALIVSEATQISPSGQGYSFTPGLHSADQIAGWRLVTEAVHAAGGRIFAQLWHVGRMSHRSFHDGAAPVAPSALDSGARVWVSVDGVGTMVPTSTPRALTTEEVRGVVEDYRRAAAAAVEAGFDGVELHGANGYLIDQFLRTTSNHRTDEYGGSLDGRLRFAVEVATAVAGEIGADRVGLRLSPQITARGMDCPGIEETVLELARRVDRIGLVYLHLAEADWDDAPEIPDAFRTRLRDAFSGRIVVAGGYTPERAERILAAGHADLVAFGRPFVANPDLPARIATGAPLAALDPDLLYGGDARGYTDFPSADRPLESAATRGGAL